MIKLIYALRAVVGIFSLLLITGCANSPMMADMASAKQQGNVIGEFGLVKNGHAVALDSQPLGNRAYIHVSNMSRQPIATALVQKDGTFELALQPGAYVIDTVGFEHHGELIESQASFFFELESAERTYIGAMSLEVTLENSAHGVVGTADRMTVANSCGADCDADISIMRWNAQTAQTQ